jgi:hypothetical protein
MEHSALGAAAEVALSRFSAMSRVDQRSATEQRCRRTALGRSEV